MIATAVYMWGDRLETRFPHHVVEVRTRAEGGGDSVGILGANRRLASRIGPREKQQTPHKSDRSDHCTDRTNRFHGSAASVQVFTGWCTRSE